MTISSVRTVGVAVDLGEARAVALTISLNGVVPALIDDHARLPAFVAELEALGVDQVVIGEHLLQAHVEHPGAVRVDLTIPFVDPFAALAVVAGTTRSIGLT